MGLEFLYNQITGDLHHRENPSNCDVSCSSISRIGNGYSGYPGYINDPAHQYLPDKGVIPKGCYSLARALYQGPKVLFLDEGTTNLDELSNVGAHGTDLGLG